MGGKQYSNLVLPVILDCGSRLASKTKPRVVDTVCFPASIFDTGDKGDRKANYHWAGNSARSFSASASKIGYSTKLHVVASFHAIPAIGKFIGSLSDAES